MDENGDDDADDSDQVSRESKTGGVPGGVSTALAMGVPNVPIIVWRCVEEVERRGLDIIGEL